MMCVPPSATMTRGLKRDVTVTFGTGSAGSTECPYDEGTETTWDDMPPRGGQCSTECPYDEGTETISGWRWSKPADWRSTECPYDEGTETRVAGVGVAPTLQEVPPSAPMTR